MLWILIVARVLHILGGIFWVGSVLTSVLFLKPAAATTGSAGERVLGEIIKRRHLTNVMTASAVTAVLAGGYLYWNDSGGLQLGWITTHTGLAFSAGAIAALSAFVLAGVFIKPGYERLADLADQAENASEHLDQGQSLQREAERLAARLRPFNLVEAALLIFAAVAMATARYIP